MTGVQTCALPIFHEERGPYFFRYVCRWLDGHGRGEAIAAKVLAAERALLAAKAIVPLGWRLVLERERA